ncbi:MAG: TAXI family TRAP transporter solute-binding subunit [Candidatus Binatia bacterium]
MRSTLSRSSRFLSFLILLAFGFCTPADAQSLPRSVTVGSNPPGTVFYALASGLSKVASEGAPFQMVVQPYSGTSTFLPLLDSGEIDFGINNAVDMALSYQGPERLKIGGRNPFQHTPNVRLVMRGAILMTAFLVRKDSTMKTVQDIRGKRVTGEYPAQLANWYNVFGFLAGSGMKFEDVKIVPVPGANEGVDALMQGRADVALHAVDSAKVKEADAAIGVRHLSLDCSAQGEKRLRAAVPGYYPHWLKRGQTAGIADDTCVNAYDIYLTTHKGVADRVVVAVVKNIWDNVDKLPPLHPSFKDWTRPRAVDGDVTMPYHPAVVQFYKERGAWPAAMDEAQRKLLSLNPQ